MADEDVYALEESIHVAAPPEDVYDVVSDVTRTGEWSPICVRCAWDEGEGPYVGAGFTGYNVKPDREWQTRNEVVAAERGRAFAWELGGGGVRWAYEMAPEGEGTRLTETWRLRRSGCEMLREMFGDDGEHQIAVRLEDARSGIPVTLAAIKAVVERRRGHPGSGRGGVGTGGV